MALTTINDRLHAVQQAADAHYAGSKLIRPYHPLTLPYQGKSATRKVARGKVPRP